MLADTFMPNNIYNIFFRNGFWKLPSLLPTQTTEFLSKNETKGPGHTVIKEPGDGRGHDTVLTAQHAGLSSDLQST